MNEKFWKDRKVLLTGHSGFKGTWMSLMLEYLGARICGYSLPIEMSSFYASVNPYVEKNVEADIADSYLVKSTINGYQPEIIFHFAAHSSLRDSMEIPDYIMKTNLMGTLNVLEAARMTESVCAVVVVTSDKCYFDCKKNESYKEDSILWATDPYSASKVCQELLSACYRDTFFQNGKKRIAIATARASNVIGPGDCFVNNKVPKIRNPHAIRPWQYVLDVLYGYLLLAEQLYLNVNKTTEFNGAFNFGPLNDAYVDVERVTKIVSDLFGGAPYQVVSGKDNIPRETNILMLDSTKAQRVLNWEPRYNIEKMLAETVKFIREEKKGYSKAVLARRMVAKYLS